MWGKIKVDLYNVIVRNKSLSTHLLKFPQNSERTKRERSPLEASPLRKVRNFRSCSWTPFPLSLATGSSTSRCPRKESLFPSGKNLSTIGYLIRGEFPALNLPSYGLLTKAPSFTWCMSPAKTDRVFGNYIFPSIRSVRRVSSANCDFTAGAPLARAHRGELSYLRNEQLYPAYLHRCQLKLKLHLFIYKQYFFCCHSPHNALKMLKETKAKSHQSVCLSSLFKL